MLQTQNKTNKQTKSFHPLFALQNENKTRFWHHFDSQNKNETSLFLSKNEIDTAFEQKKKKKKNPGTLKGKPCFLFLETKTTK